MGKGGNYVFSLANYKGVEKDFLGFAVGITFSNSTTNETIYLGWASIPLIGTKTNATAYLFLSPGKYNLTLELTYIVNQVVTPVNFENVIVKMNNSPLISVNLGIQAQLPTFQNLAFAKPVYINMGKLNNTYGGPFSNLSIMSVPSGGEFLFEMRHTAELEKDFSSFFGIITLYNSTEKIEIPIGSMYFFFFNFSTYNNTVYLSPGVYKMNVSIYYYLNNSVTPMSFKGTIIYLDYTPLVNVNFIVTNISSPSPFPRLYSQPTVTQVGTGVIYENGTAVVKLESTGSVDIVGASIAGTAYTANISSITPYQLTAGLNTVTINFGSISIQPGSTYSIELYLSDGETVLVTVVAQ